jgi:hypothetical protein
MKSDREDIRWIQRFSNYKKSFSSTRKIFSNKESERI